jgi:ribosomal protein L19E
MAIIEIKTTQDEQRKVLDAIAKLEGQTVALSKIAEVAKIPENRTRYVITDLLDAGKIKRIATKAMSKHYVRYRYELVK